MPTDMRIRPGAVRSSPACRLRRSIDVSTPPRLVAWTISSAVRHTVSAASADPSTNDISAPKPVICRLATAWPGSVARPG